MNLPSDTGNGRVAQQDLAAGATAAEALPAFLVPGSTVSPFEFRALAAVDVDATGGVAVSRREKYSSIDRAHPKTEQCPVQSTHGLQYAAGGFDFGARETSLRSAVETARREGWQQGELEGRRAARAELEVEMRTAISQERRKVATAVSEFCGVRERYFADVEQEVVKLALAIAARVLHREAQMDPLLLSGVVRVALEKMADRSGVVLRVAEGDREAWEREFSTAEASEKPTVMADARLGGSECVLETRMGTVELGVGVQLEEIEKGFFDLLHHRPVE